MDKIEYVGDPLKAVMPEGYYLFTLIAKDVPVTKICVGDMLCTFSIGFKRDERVRMSRILVGFTNFQPFVETHIIGEQVILYEVLYNLLANSIDAGATRFQIELKEVANRLCMVLSDDGAGISQSVLKELFHGIVTTKSNGLGLSLFAAYGNMKKIGGNLSYCGTGLGGRGASFGLTLLREMPSQ